MKRKLRAKWMWTSLFVALLAGGAAAADYYDHATTTEHLASLGRQDPNTVRVCEIAKSREGRDVWMVELGQGSDRDRAARPAMLVVAGIEGDDLAGPFTAISWIERLARHNEDPNAAKLLETTTIYVVPCLNPDATERYFAKPTEEIGRNGAPNDEDHDGLIDEDGCEDLNGDGLITMMRVEDKEGRYIADPNESRLMLPTDPLKGEVPVWKLLPEGLDNDHDKRWNEDGPGGVNFNRNFPYNYKYFAADAGLHPVSETETRALADFVVAHPNIGIVLTYGAADNLRKTPRSAASPGRSKPMEAISDKDIGYFETLGKAYRAKLGLEKELEVASEPGTFSDWMYFHRGRLSWRPARGTRRWRWRSPNRKKTRKRRTRRPGAGTERPQRAPGRREKARKNRSDDKRGKDERGPARLVRRPFARRVRRMAGDRASGLPRPASRDRRLQALRADEPASGDARRDRRQARGVPHGPGRSAAANRGGQDRMPPPGRLDLRDRDPRGEHGLPADGSGPRRDQPADPPHASDARSGAGVLPGREQDDVPARPGRQRRHGQGPLHGPCGGPDRDRIRGRLDAGRPRERNGRAAQARRYRPQLIRDIIVESTRHAE